MSTNRADTLHEPTVTLVARKLDITPGRPVVLASSPARTPATEVFEPLEANLLLLRSADEAYLLVTLDLLYPGAVIRQAIEEAFGGDPAHVLVGASHTHYAPSTLDDKPGLGALDTAYLTDLASELRAVVRSMLAAQPVTASAWTAGAQTLDHSIHRRRPTRRGVKMAPNRSGPRDELATVVVASDDHGPAAIIWNYACHPVSHPRPGMVAAHYPGVVRERLRQLHDRPDLPVLFFQGFSGDTRPSATTRLHRPRDVAQLLRFGVGFYNMSLGSYRRWSGSLADAVVGVARSATPVRVTGLAGRRSVHPLSEFVEGGPDGKQVAFQSLELRPSIAFVGGSAEMVSSFATELRSEAAPDQYLLPVGCLDDCFGYVPTEEMKQEGGYEAGGFCEAFGYRSLRSEAPVRARNALRDVSGDGRGPS